MTCAADSHDPDWPNSRRGNHTGSRWNLWKTIVKPPLVWIRFGPWFNRPSLREIGGFNSSTTSHHLTRAGAATNRLELPFNISFICPSFTKRFSFWYIIRCKNEPVTVQHVGKSQERRQPRGFPTRGRGWTSGTPYHLVETASPAQAIPEHANSHACCYDQWLRRQSPKWVADNGILARLYVPSLSRLRHHMS